jgi:hypothetical protein
MDLIENPYLSDFTKKTLRQFLWQPGDPIPAALGELLLKIKETLPASSRTDVMIDASIMPAEALVEVNDLLRAAKQFVDRQKKAEGVNAVTQNMTPSVRAAFEQLAVPQIIDDRETQETALPPAAPAPEPVPTPAPEPPKVETPEENPLAPKESPVLANDPMIVLPFCPRCGWDMRQKFDVEVTDNDKEDFIAVTLGNARFKKKYELMGGRLVITLRSLLAEENKLIYQQLVADQQANKIKSQTDWYTQMLEYRLACSLESMADKTGRVISVVPELHEMPFTPDKDRPLETPMTALFDFVNTKVLAQEVTKRLVGTHLRHFQRLLEALEAMTLEPSFWTGIE